MQEVKLSTRIKGEKSAELAIKLDVESLGLKWKEGDIIRMKAFPKEGRIALSRMRKRHDRTIAYKLTSTGSGSAKHKVGIYVANTKGRFAKPFVAVKAVEAAVRKNPKRAGEIDIFLPKEIFAENTN